MTALKIIYPSGSTIMSRTSLIKLIHIARRDLRLDEDTYRAALASVVHGKTSCREMNISELERVLDNLKAHGFKKKRTHRRLNSTQASSHKVRAIWRQMYTDGFISEDSDTALDSFVERITSQINGGKGISTLAWCRDDMLLKVIESLKKWHVRCMCEVFEKKGIALPISKRTGLELRGYEAITEAYAQAQKAGRFKL